MTDLLDMAVAAHGGLERWSTIKTIDYCDDTTTPLTSSAAPPA